LTKQKKALYLYLVIFILIHN